MFLFALYQFNNIVNILGFLTADVPRLTMLGYAPDPRRHAEDKTFIDGE